MKKPLEANERNNPQAVEQHFCKYFEQFEPQEMDEIQMKMFLMIGFSKDTNLKQMEKDIEGVFHIYPAIQKRVEYMYDFEMDARARMILVTWCHSFGDISMYLAYIQYKCKELNIRKVGYMEIGTIFPKGIPDREFLSKAWDKQKVESKGLETDNLLDIKNAQKSILFNENTQA